MPESLGIQDGSMKGNSTLQTQGAISTIINKYSVTYYVLGDDMNTDEDDIKATVGIPTLYSTRNGATCNSVVPSVITTIAKHPVTGVMCELWEVAVGYDSTVNSESGGGGGGGSPTDMTPTAEWSSENIEQILRTDAITGSPIETKNHEPILHNYNVVRPILRISGYWNSPFDKSIIYSYVNRINSADFWGVGGSGAFMNSITATPEIVNGVQYEKVVFEIMFLGGGEDSFYFKPLHQGTLYREVKDGPILKALDKHGKPRVVNLDIDGVKLADDADPVFLFFVEHPQADFNLLNLGPF